MNLTEERNLYLMVKQYGLKEIIFQATRFYGELNKED